MTGPLPPQLNAFRQAYASALSRYVDEPSEASLTVAYELGRSAVTQQLTVLDLTVAYQEALTRLLSQSDPTRQPESTAQAAGDFFLESMSSFEMLHRGAGAARDSISRQLRNTRLSRQLSSFLADSSLAVLPESLEEALLLAVDLGREIIAADCCHATVSARDSPRAAEAISHSGADAEWRWVRWQHLPTVYRLLDERQGSFRLIGQQVTRTLSHATTMAAPEISSWLAISLTSLDGTPIGALQAYVQQPGSFRAEDEAALAHLAQMLSGAAERMRIYHRGAH